LSPGRFIRILRAAGSQTHLRLPQTYTHALSPFRAPLSPLAQIYKPTRRRIPNVHLLPTPAPHRRFLRLPLALHAPEAKGGVGGDSRKHAEEWS
ncbi:hypothetical protein K525DRAFT_189574, partial [Schizophyllum commune Loenen D]